MTPRPNRPLAALLGLAACFAFSSCENTGSRTGSNSHDVVDYTSPTTRMSKKEKENYAFDENGRYRESWVAANSGGRSTGISEKVLSTDTPSPYVQEDISSSPPDYTPPRGSSSSSRSTSSTLRKTVSASSSTSRKASSSGSRKSTASTSKSKKKPPSKSGAKPTVVTIKPGDTLYSFSKKTGVSVERLKAYNGMKSDVVVDGKKLKIPPKR